VTMFLQKHPKTAISSSRSSNEKIIIFLHSQP
jgi:hypothetical protein